MRGKAQSDPEGPGRAPMPSPLTPTLSRKGRGSRTALETGVCKVSSEWGAYEMLAPPSIESVWPVMWLARSEARKTAPAPNCSGGARRLSRP